MQPPPRIAAVPTPLTQPFWDACNRGELQVQYCTDCARYLFPPRRWCPECLGAAVEWRTVSGRARLHSYLIQHRAAAGYTEADLPYAVALVELDEGPRLMTHIAGVPNTPDDLTLDMPLRVGFVERAGMPLPVFEPATDREHDR